MTGRRTLHAVRGGWIAAALAAALAAGACSAWDVKEKSGDLEKAVEDYNKMVRWGRVSEASGWVVPEDRSEFRETYGDAMEKVRIADYEIQEVLQDPANENVATARIKIRYYRSPSVTVKTVRQNQEWTYRADQEQWLVKPPPVLE